MKKKGFTLIELLAVIIILGILVLVAIPSVTSYINNSRKETYVDSIGTLIKGASAKVNGGDLQMYDTDTTYYVPVSAIQMENGGMKSPYGDMDEAYVAVTFDGENYDYYFVGKDTANMGVGELTKKDNITKNSIENVTGSIPTDVGIEGKSKIVVFNNNLEPSPATLAASFVSGAGGTGSGASNVLCEGNNCTCKRATQLHQPTCEYDGNSRCNGSGEPGYGNPITYGQLGTSGSLHVGDAFDCDINGDGNYNPANERFYYVTTNGNYAVLLYYTNTLGGVPDSAADLTYYGSTKLADDEGDCVEDFYSYHSFVNYMGPLGALGHSATNNPDYTVALPTTSQWSNVRLSSTTRAITGPNGETSIAGHTLPNNFSYSGYAARLLTYQELASACNLSPVGYNVYISSACRFMKENTYYDITESNATSSYTDYCYGPYYNSYATGGFFLETPEPSGAEEDGYYYGEAYYVSFSGIVSTSVDGAGFRPAIEVNINKVEGSH